MLLPNSKLLTLEQAIETRKTLRTAGKSMVMTNGCFDLLHVGHLSYLRASRKLGDQLWILINSDESVRVAERAESPDPKRSRACLLSRRTQLRRPCQSSLTVHASLMKSSNSSPTSTPKPATTRSTPCINRSVMLSTMRALKFNFCRTSKASVPRK